MFKQTCYFLDSSEWVAAQKQQCWYWFEADNTPLTPVWLDVFKAEYKKNGGICMGYRDGSALMMGTGVYALPMISHVPSYQTIDRVEFDVHIRHDVMLSAYSTSLLHWTWCSYNYRWENGLMVGYHKNIRSNTLQISESSPVDPKAVISHGCKDGSLIKLVREKMLYNCC